MEEPSVKSISAEGCRDTEHVGKVVRLCLPMKPIFTCLRRQQELLLVHGRTHGLGERHGGSETVTAGNAWPRRSPSLQPAQAREAALLRGRAKSWALAWLKRAPRTTSDVPKRGRPRGGRERRRRQRRDEEGGVAKRGAEAGGGEGP